MYRCALWLHAPRCIGDAGSVSGDHLLIPATYLFVSEKQDQSSERELKGQFTPRLSHGRHVRVDKHGSQDCDRQKIVTE